MNICSSVVNKKNMIIKKNLFTPNKLSYVRGNKPKVDCILCSVVKKDKKVDNLVVFEGKQLFVTLNLYPYNPGHLMIFPKRHIEHIKKLQRNEWNELYDLQLKCINILDKVYQPQGYNLGFNIGKSGGASIPHIHFHIIPRYLNEIGIVEIMSDARLIVENPNDTLKKLKKYFK